METTKNWYYLPSNKWFNNRKEAKEYLGGTYYFNIELRKHNIIFIPR